MKIQKTIITSTTLLMVFSLMLIIFAVLFILDHGLEKQKDALLNDLHRDVDARVNTGNMVLQQSISNYIRGVKFTTSTLSNDKIISEGIINGQWESMDNHLYGISKRTNVDFILVFDNIGRLQSSYPSQMLKKHPEDHFKNLSLFKVFQKHIDDEDLTDAPIITSFEKFSHQVQKDYKIYRPGNNNVMVLTAGIIPNEYMDEAVGYIMVGIKSSRFAVTLNDFFKTTGQVALLADGSTPLVWAGTDGEKNDIRDSLKGLDYSKIKAADNKGITFEGILIGKEYYHFFIKPFDCLSKNIIKCSGIENIIILVGEPNRLFLKHAEKMQTYGKSVRTDVIKAAFFIAILVLFSAFFIIRLIGKKIATPIVRAADISKKIAANDFSQIFEKSVYEETNQLAESMNIMTRTLGDYRKNNIKQIKTLRDNEIELRHQTELANKMAAESEIASKVKSEFLANMSHEIRTPMNAIIGIGRMLQKTKLNKQQENYIKKVNMASNHLLGIINDILDFSKVEAGKLELDFHNFKMDDVLSNLKTILRTQSEDKGISLLFNLSNDVPQFLIGDSLRLGQVLTNLLGNAIKFSEKGVVELSISLVKMIDRQSNKNTSKLKSSIQGNEARIRFEVRDTGIGMSEEQIAGLFNAFSQADTSTTRKYGGTGLGLVISRGLLECMGGDLKLISKLGYGSIFSFELNFPVRKALLSLDKWTELDLKRILVVDDHKVARLIIRGWFDRIHVEVEEAEDGLAAIEAVKVAYKAGKTFDFILMDWNMPGEDGLDVVRKLNEMSDAGFVDMSHTFIFIISAYKLEDFPTDIPHFDAFLSKPVIASDLFNEMSKAKGLVPILPVNEKEIEIPELKDISILLVEDNLMNQEVALDLLKDTGAEVVIAENGKEALEILDKQHFDLILMDLQMPVMDGFEATRHIRKRKLNVPIIALSAAVMKDDIQKSKEAGVDMHIAKPIDVFELYKAMNFFIKSSSKKIQLQSDNETSSSKLPKFLDGFDLQRGLILANNKVDSYHKMLLRFKEQLDSEFINIMGIIGTNEEEAVRKVHTLKGLAGTIGALDLGKTAALINSAMLDGSEITKDMYRELEQNIAEVKRSLASLPAISDDFSEVDIEQGKTALKEIIEVLKRDETPDRDVLKMVKNYIQQTAGKDKASEFQYLIENYEFESAVNLLAIYMEVNRNEHDKI